MAKGEEGRLIAWISSKVVEDYDEINCCRKNKRERIAMDTSAPGHYVSHCKQ